MSLKALTYSLRKRLLPEPLTSKKSSLYTLPTSVLIPKIPGNGKLKVVILKIYISLCVTKSFKVGSRGLFHQHFGAKCKFVSTRCLALIVYFNFTNKIVPNFTSSQLEVKPNFYAVCSAVHQWFSTFYCWLSK